MKSALRKLLSCLMLAACGLAVLPLAAQEGPLDTALPANVTPDEIIKHFAANETEFAQAREQYTFRQDVKVQTLDGDTPDGEYREVFDVIFDDKGKRTENVVFAPQSTLSKISMTQEDMEDIRHRLPFVLTTADLPEYNVLYVGQQQEDDLHCYAFDIAPKKIEGKKRYFQGRVWVDDKDFQIVKTYGKTVPDIRKKHGNGSDENLFPKFTTWRQHAGRAHQGNREVRRLQALRIEREDSLPRQGTAEGSAEAGSDSGSETAGRESAAKVAFSYQLSAIS
ncbi:MAG: hypothetical protein ABR921_12040 [Candidatus Sulfotelmatobacter sp.]